MDKYEKITKARNLFSIKDKETIREIKRKINECIKEWHPDSGNKSEEECKEKSIALLNAKEIIIDYLENYKITFEENEIEKYLSPREILMKKFGNDHLWGNGKTE